MKTFSILRAISSSRNTIFFNTAWQHVYKFHFIHYGMGKTWNYNQGHSFSTHENPARLILSNWASQVQQVASDGIKYPSIVQKCTAAFTFAGTCCRLTALADRDMLSTLWQNKMLSEYQFPETPVLVAHFGLTLPLWTTLHKISCTKCSTARQPILTITQYGKVNHHKLTAVLQAFSFLLKYWHPLHYYEKCTVDDKSEYVHACKYSFHSDQKPAEALETRHPYTTHNDFIRIFSCSFTFYFPCSRAQVSSTTNQDPSDRVFHHFKSAIGQSPVLASSIQGLSHSPV